MNGKRLVIAATASTLVFGVGGYVYREEHRPAVLDVYVFNLPQGRSMFVRTPDDRRILIDGGGTTDVIRELSRILPFYSRRIDTIISTNTDKNNVSGLIDVVRRYTVDTVYVPAVTLNSLGIATTSDQTYVGFLNTVNVRRLSIEDAVMGNTLLLGSSTTLKILFPADESLFTYSRASAPEILFRIDYGQTSVTFLGDSSHKTQDFLAGSGNMQKTDAIIISQNVLTAHLSSDLIHILQPTYVAYEENIRAKAPISTKNPVLAGILPDNLLNIREIGTVHLVSDGNNFVYK